MNPHEKIVWAMKEAWRYEAEEICKAWNTENGTKIFIDALNEVTERIDARVADNAARIYLESTR